MSILFERKNKKVIKFIFGVLGLLIIISMILFYAPGFLPGTEGAGI